MQVAAPRVIFEGVRSDGLPWRVHVTGQVCVWRRGRDGRARVGLGSLKAARGVKAKKGREREDVTINGAGGVFMEKDGGPRSVVIIPNRVPGSLSVVNFACLLVSHQYFCLRNAKGVCARKACACSEMLARRLSILVACFCEVRPEHNAVYHTTGSFLQATIIKFKVSELRQSDKFDGKPRSSVVDIKAAEKLQKVMEECLRASLCVVCALCTRYDLRCD